MKFSKKCFGIIAAVLTMTGLIYVVSCSSSVTNKIGFLISGQTAGLTESVVLQLNGGFDITVAGDGSFSFAETVNDTKPYAVTVKTPPTGQTCTVTNGEGVVAAADVTNISVVCTTVPSIAPIAYSVGGTVAGLSGTLVLQNNLADDLSLSSDGAFAFGTELADAATYAVTILTQPANQFCTAATASGTIATADVTSVTVTCVTLNSLTLTFDANGGTGTMSAQTFAAGETANLSVNTFTKASSTFAGWAETPTGGVIFNDGQTYTMGSSDVTLYARWVNTADLLVSYHFNNQDCTDGSSNAAHCTANNLTYVADGSGYAASLNGTSSYMELPSNLIRNNPNFTIMMRFKANSTQFGSLVGYQNTALNTVPGQFVPLLAIRSDGKLRGELWIGSALEVISTNAVNDGLWHTVYFSATAGTIKLFLDGAEIGSNSGTVQHLAMTFNQIGVARAQGRTLMPSATAASNNWFYFNGLVDDFKVYSTAL